MPDSRRSGGALDETNGAPSGAAGGLDVPVLSLALVGSLAVGFGARSSPVARQASPEASSTAFDTFTVGGLVDTPLTLTVASLQALGLPVETVKGTYQAAGAEESHSFIGVRLYALLDAAGIAAEPDARNPLLPRYVVVSANDGYRVVFSGGELDPNFGNAPILVAWERDGAPLSGSDGPVRIVAPGDLGGGRYVLGVVSIDLFEIEA